MNSPFLTLSWLVLGVLFIPTYLSFTTTLIVVGTVIIVFTLGKRKLKLRRCSLPRSQFVSAVLEFEHRECVGNHPLQHLPPAHGHTKKWQSWASNLCLLDSPD